MVPSARSGERYVGRLGGQPTGLNCRAQGQVDNAGLWRRVATAACRLKIPVEVFLLLWGLETISISIMRFFALVFHFFVLLLMVVPGGETRRARQKPRNTGVSRMGLGPGDFSPSILLLSLGSEPPGSTPQGFSRDRTNRAPT